MYDRETGIQSVFFLFFLFGINKTIYRKELDVKILLFPASPVWVGMVGEFVVDTREGKHSLGN